jgi:N-acetylglucosamine malate deacetylase 2
VPPCILLSFAHPDDESFSGAGLACRYLAEGVRIVLVTATLGQAGKAGDPPVCSREDLPGVREAELREAAGVIGIDALHLLGYRDRELAEAPPARIRAQLVGLIRHYRPHVVVTFDPNGFNVHPDHVAISRFTVDAVSAAADARWIRDAGPAHRVQRLIWTPPIPPWDAARSVALEAEPGVDFVLDLSEWRDRKAAALRAHRTQHQSIDRYFFSQPDRERVLSVETYRHAWGPELSRRPSGDVLEGLDLGADRA